MRVVARLDRQQFGQVAHIAGHGPFGTELADPYIRCRPIGHAALAGAKAEHVVPGSGVAQRPHEVRAVGHRQQAVRKCHCRAAAAATGTHTRVPGIRGCAEQVVEGVRAQPELGHVGLGDDDAAGRLHARRHHRVLRRNGVFQQRAAQGGGKARGVAGVLDGLRNAVQPAARTVRTSRWRQVGVACVGLGEQHVIGCKVHQRIEPWVQRLDARQVGLHHLAARNLARMDGARQGVGVELGQRGVWCHRGASVVALCRTGRAGVGRVFQGRLGAKRIPRGRSLGLR